MKTAQGKNQFQQEKFFEDQAAVIGRLPGVEFRKIIFRGWKMNMFQGCSNVGKRVRFPDVRRQRIVHVLCKVGQCSRNDPAELAARDSGNFLVNRYNTRDIDGARGFAVIEKLELRVEEHEFRLVTVEVHPAVKNDFAAGVEIASLKISTVKPLGVGKAAAISENHVKNLAACSRLNDPAAVHARVNCRVLSDAQRRKRDEACAVLI